MVSCFYRRRLILTRIGSCIIDTVVIAFIHKEVEHGEGGSEEEVAHELWLDGEARRMWESEGTIGAARTEEGILTGETNEIKDALDETEHTNERSRDNKRDENITS